MQGQSGHSQSLAEGFRGLYGQTHLKNLCSKTFTPKYIDYDIQKYNFAFCFNGCETWSLTLREDCRPKLFENTVLRRIYGPKRNDVTVLWIKLHDEDLSGLYSSPNTGREM